MLRLKPKLAVLLPRNEFAFYGVSLLGGLGYSDSMSSIEAVYPTYSHLLAKSNDLGPIVKQESNHIGYSLIFWQEALKRSN